MLAHYFCALGHACKFVLRCENLFRIGPWIEFNYCSASLHQAMGSQRKLKVHLWLLEITLSTIIVGSQCPRTRLSFFPYSNGTKSSDLWDHLNTRNNGLVARSSKEKDCENVLNTRLVVCYSDHGLVNRPLDNRLFSTNWIRG